MNSHCQRHARTQYRQHRKLAIEAAQRSATDEQFDYLLDQFDNLPRISPALILINAISGDAA